MAIIIFKIITPNIQIRRSSLLLRRLRRILNSITRSEHLKLLERNLILVLEVPLDQVLELALLKLETTALNQLLEVIGVDALHLVMLNPIKKSVQKHVVLLLVRELVIRLHLKRLH